MVNRLLVAWLLAMSSSFGCGEDACREPDPRGAGSEGDPCITTRECAAGLVCIGTDFQQGAHCVIAGELPGGADPGCLEHASDWPEHEADGVEPAGPDEDGCERLVFVSSCNCRGSAGDDCLPEQPLYRREVWRRCGCCWRLVVLWHADDACEEGE
jgi:hypothetical protein